MAHFGQTIDPATISIQTELDSADTDSHGLARAPAVPVPAASSEHRPASGHDGPNGKSNGSPNGSTRKDPMARQQGALSTGVRVDAIRPPADSQAHDPALERAACPARLESVELSTTEHGLRCRVAISVAGQTFTGIGDGPGQPTDVTDLAARVTIDALRAARCPANSMQLEGTATTLVRGNAYVITAVAIWNGSDFDRVSGAQPVLGTAAEAAALSVIRSVTERMQSTND
jgi:hypothetical protein